MKLMMYIGNDLIETIALESERVSKPGYLGQFKRNLKMKYREMIRMQELKPDFIIIKAIPDPFSESVSPPYLGENP